MLIGQRTGFYPLARARAIAAELQAADDDGWQYVVADCGNGFGRIDVFDESGELIQSGVIFY